MYSAPKMISANLANMPLGRLELSHKNSFAKVFEWNQTCNFSFSFHCLLWIFTVFTQFHFKKSLDSLYNIWSANSSTAVGVGLTVHSNYMHKVILTKKIANKINEPCYCEVLGQQSARVKRSFIFSVMLSDSQVRHLRCCRKQRVSL